MSGYTPAKKSTTKAQRKNDGPRGIARGMASLGNGRARRATARSEIPSVPAQVIPDQQVPALPGDGEAEHTYLVKEHLRRDIGSRVLVLDLAAPDAPGGAGGVFRDPDGVALPWVADCVTHQAQKYFGAYATACRAAKASHQWCPGCKTALARHHRLQSTISAQASARR